VCVIVIGTSAGGVQALKTLLGDLGADLDVVLLAVIHLAPSSPGFLPNLFCKPGRLCCVHPSQGERLQRGRFYLAPPDRHMLIEARGTIRLSHGPKENRARPAIDPLFRSAALAFGSDVIGVILTGNLDDGTEGLLAVKRSGGATVIQDPADAVAPSMPSSAANHVDIDHKVPLSKMAPLLVRLSASEKAMLGGKARIGNPSLFTCAESAPVPRTKAALSECSRVPSIQGSPAPTL